MSDSVAAGLFSLSGVVVGAAATTLTTWWMGQRAAKSATMVAARLVHEELLNNHASLRLTAQTGAVPHIGVESGAWKEHKSQLARGLSESGAWEAVVDAYVALRRFGNVTPGTTFAQPSEPMYTLTTIRKAIRVLARETGGSDHDFSPPVAQAGRDPEG